MTLSFVAAKPYMNELPFIRQNTFLTPAFIVN
jgi:hypothetical protein